MSQFLQSWTLKKLIQRYLGEFLSSEVSLDQLSMELSEGSAQMSNLDMNTNSINENLSRLNIPLELLDGYAGIAKVNVPWLKMVNEPTKVTVEDLQLTFQKSSSSTYSTVLQAFSSEDLAESVLEAIFDQGPSNSNEVTEFFTKLVKSVFSSFCVEFRRITIRLENDDGDLAVALELRIEKVVFTYEKSENPEFQKKFEIEGISLYTDIFSKSSTSSGSHAPETQDSDAHHRPVSLDGFQTCLETLNPESSSEAPDAPEEAPEAPEPQGNIQLQSDPIKMLEITGPIQCLFRTSYKSDHEKKTLTSIDIKISIDTSIDVFASCTQLEIVKTSIDSLMPLSVSQGRPMTEDDFEMMNQSVKELSFNSIRSYHEESQLISLTVEATSLNLCIPLIDPLAHVDSESLEVQKQDSECFFTDKRSYQKDHFLITNDFINLKFKKSSESLNLDVSSGSLLINGLDSTLLEVSSIDISVLSVDEEVITIDMKMGECRSDLEVERILEAKLETLFKREEATTTTGPLKFHVTCPAYQSIYHFGSEEAQLIIKDLSVEVDKDASNLLITSFLSEAQGSYHNQDILHIKGATLSLFSGPRDSSDKDEEEEAVDLDDLLEKSFSNFQKIPGPFSQVPNSYNAENGQVVELLPPGTRQEMLEFHKEASGNQVKVQIQRIQMHVPEKTELEKLHKLVQELLNGSSESQRLQNPRDSYHIGVEVADSVILLNTMNPTTKMASQVALCLQNLHLGADSEYLHLTSSGLKIGFCADNLMPRILGEADFGAFSKRQIQMCRRQKCNEDVLAVAIGSPGCLQKIVSVALRNWRIQARPVRIEELDAFWVMQLVDLFGFLASDEHSESREDAEIQVTLENLQVDYDHGWIHSGSGVKLAGVMEKCTMVGKPGKKTSPLLLLLDNIKLHLLHPSIQPAQILDTGSIQLELFPHSNTIRCFTDLLKASVTSDELPIFLNLVQEYSSWQFPTEKPSESSLNPPEDHQEQERIEKMIKDAMSEESSKEYHREELFVVDDKAMDLNPTESLLEDFRILDSESPTPESEATFQLHLEIGQIQISLLNRQTSESVILNLEKVKILPKLLENSQKSIFLEICDFSIKDRIPTSDIDMMAYPIFTSERRKKRSAIKVNVELNQDKTGRLKVSLPDIKINLDQDTLEFLEKYYEEFVIRWSTENYGDEYVLDTEGDFMMMAESEFRKEYLPRPSGDSSTSESPLTYFTHFVFAPEARISIDYQGKSKIPRRSNLFDVFQGLVQLQGVPIKLAKIDTKRGILGVEKILEFALDQWNAALPMSAVVSSFTPIRPIVRSLVDLISHPVAEIQKEQDGSLMRGIGRGVGAFGVSSASGVLGMAQTVTGVVQSVVEYGVTANAPTTSRSRRRRQTSLLPSFVSMTQATQNLLGGLRGHICPDEVQDEKRKYGNGSKK